MSFVICRLRKIFRVSFYNTSLFEATFITMESIEVHSLEEWKVAPQAFVVQSNKPRREGENKMFDYSLGIVASSGKRGCLFDFLGCTAPSTRCFHSKQNCQHEWGTDFLSGKWVIKYIPTCVYFNVLRLKSTVRTLSNQAHYGWRTVGKVAHLKAVKQKCVYTYFCI